MPPTLSNQLQNDFKTLIDVNGNALATNDQNQPSAPVETTQQAPIIIPQPLPAYSPEPVYIYPSSVNPSAPYAQAYARNAGQRLNTNADKAMASGEWGIGGAGTKYF